MGSYSHKEPEGRRKPGSPVGLESLLIDLDVELRQFPHGFAFRVADARQKDRVVGLIHRLVAESFVVGGAATIKIDRASEALRAQVCRAYTKNMAVGLERFETAERFLQTCPEAAAIEAEAGQARTAVVKAEAAVAAAEGRLAEAKGLAALLAGQAERRREAEGVVGTGDIHLLSAVEHLRQLRAAAD